jgi:hypothetical protein
MGAPELLRDRTVARNIPLLALSNFDVWWPFTIIMDVGTSFLECTLM